MKRLPWFPLLGVGMLISNVASGSDFDRFRDADRSAFERFHRQRAPEAPAQSPEPDPQQAPEPPAQSPAADPLFRMRDADAADNDTSTVFDSEHFRIRSSYHEAKEVTVQLAGHYEKAFSRYVQQMGLRDPRTVCALEEGRILITHDNALSQAGQDQLETGHWNGTLWLNEQHVFAPGALQRFRAASWVLFAIQHAYGDSAATRRWLGTSLRETAALDLLDPDETRMMLEASALGADYFRNAIDNNLQVLPRGQMEHGTTFFIHDLVHHGGLDWKALFEAVMASEADEHYRMLQNHVAAAVGRPLGMFYRDFARRTFLGGKPGPAPSPHRRSILGTGTRLVRERFALKANCTAAAWLVSLHPSPESLAQKRIVQFDEDPPEQIYVDIMDATGKPDDPPLLTLSAGQTSAVIDTVDLENLLILIANTGPVDGEISLSVARFDISIESGRQLILDLAAGTSEAEVELLAQVSPPGDYRVEWDFGDGDPFVEVLSPDQTESKAAHHYADLKHGQIFTVSATLFEASAGANDVPLAKDAVTVKISIRDDAADWECGVDFDWSNAEKVDVNFETYYRIWDTTNGQPGVPVRHGPRWMYHDKDKHMLQSRSCYREGVPVGRFTSWFRNGAINSELRYLEGRVTGPVQRWWTNGYPRTSGTLVAKNHDSIWEVELGSNIWDGLFESWYEDGKPERATPFRMGVKDGKHRSWYANGQLEFETDYKDDRKHGEHRHWKEDGSPEYAYRFHEDRMHGPQVYWSRWGERQEGTYEQGEQRGVWLRYASDGRTLWRQNPPWVTIGAPWRDTATDPPP